MMLKVKKQRFGLRERGTRSSSKIVHHKF